MLSVERRRQRFTSRARQCTCRTRHTFGRDAFGIGCQEPGAASDGIWGWRAADGDPARLGEFFEAGAAAEFPVAAVFLAAARHLRLVVNRRTVDVGDSELEALCEFQ